MSSFGFGTGDGFAAGDESRHVGQRDLFEEQRQDERHSDERQQVPEHGGQGVGVRGDDAVAKRLGARNVGLSLSKARKRWPEPVEGPETLA